MEKKKVILYGLVFRFGRGHCWVTGFLIYSSYLGNIRYDESNHNGDR